MEIALNPTVDPRDAARLSKQCHALLARLGRGSATNVELMVELRILNLTARASECRQAGYDIQATRGEGGVWTYRLVATLADELASHARAAFAVSR
jgi:hypothetical protein